jgi:anthranilate synthase/aminodeoxychorismate synthase-like glutamine amidotransferase
LLLLIDNYDSFTYNLYQYFAELGVEVRVARNDKITLDQIEALKPEYIVVSPGPGTPRDAGISGDVIRRFGPELPVLGVCLGHQCLGETYGATVGRAPVIMHGKSSPVSHLGTGLFRGLPDPFTAIRYHSLTVYRETLSDVLEVTAWTADGIVMGLRHKEYPVAGIQFHPESFMTEYGKEILKNFLEQTK